MTVQTDPVKPKREYNFPSVWMLTTFKNIRRKGWFRKEKKFYQKTGKDCARRIISKNTYLSSVEFMQGESVMAHNDEIDIRNYLKDFGE